MVDVGDFGELQAQIVVFGPGEGGIDAAALVVNGTAHKAEVKGHEVYEQAIGGVGDTAALSQSMILPLCVDDFIVGVDHAHFRVSAKDGNGFGKGSGG